MLPCGSMTGHPVKALFASIALAARKGVTCACVRIRPNGALSPFAVSPKSTAEESPFLIRRQWAPLFLCFVLLSFGSSAGANPPTVPDDTKTPTAEAVAETTILIYGSRPVLEQIRRNGVERGRITRIASDGKVEES